jgi:hypothetical protein
MNGYCGLYSGRKGALEVRESVNATIIATYKSHYGSVSVTLQPAYINSDLADDSHYQEPLKFDDSASTMIRCLP